MNEQTRKHLAVLNGKTTDPELVAVVQHDENTGETVCLLNGQTIESGESVEYKGAAFPVTFEIVEKGELADEVDHSVVDHYISTEAWDPKARTIVTTSAPVYATRPGRTWLFADVRLSIGGHLLHQDTGSHVVCTGKHGDIITTLDRFAFTVPNTVWGYTGTYHEE